MKSQVEKYDMSVLFKKAKWTFTLSEDEILYLRKQLTEIHECSWQYDTAHKIHQGIAAFGLCSEPMKDNIALIEKFVDKEAFCDSVTAAALKVLCSNSYWNLAKQYEKLLCDYVNLDDNDYEETNRVAIICLGYYCHLTKQKEYIALLFSLFNKTLKEDENEEEHILDIETLYHSLEIIIWGDKYPKERRVTVGDMIIPQDINPEVIKNIQSLIM